jgi:hypothetical protein
MFSFGSAKDFGSARREFKKHKKPNDLENFRSEHSNKKLINPKNKFV